MGMETPKPANIADEEAKDIGAMEPADERETIEINLTPLITLLIGLALGFLVGFVGRPRLMPQAQIPITTTPESVALASSTKTPASAAQAASTETSASAAAQAASTETSASAAAQAAPSETPAGASNTSTNDQAEREAARQQAMDVLTSQTRHFKGDPEAPVTIIEFSDFQ